MKKVWIAPGCITCGRCEFLAPEVFEVLDVARVKPGVDISQYEAQIREAIATCPVQVIKAEEIAKNDQK